MRLSSFTVLLAAIAVGCVQHVPLTFHVVDDTTYQPVANLKVEAYTSFRWTSEDPGLSPVDWMRAAIFKWTGQDQTATGFTGPDGTVGLIAPFSHDGVTFAYSKPGLDFQIQPQQALGVGSVEELESHVIQVSLHPRKIRAASSRPATISDK